MQTDNTTLIEEMLTLTDKCSDAVRKFKGLPEHQLNYRKSPTSWSILECIEHLNRYGDFYLPALEKAILSHAPKYPARIYKSGLIGDYFARLMKITNGKMVRMKTPADKNPLGSALSVTTIDRFLKQQDMLRSLLHQARQADLTNTKVPISLTKLIKLRLGDTFRFFVYHIERHVIQAEGLIQNSKFKI
jgi:hypothetical protein